MNSEANISVTFSVLLKNLLKFRSQVSFIWTHYHDSQNDKDSVKTSDFKKVKYCNYCIEFSSYHTNISINMQQHFKQYHQINVEVTVSQIQKKAFQQLKQLYF